MTMYGTLHPISDVDRLYISRKEGGRSLMSVECCCYEKLLRDSCEDSRIC